MFKHFDKNTVGRDFVVGDIHGQYDLFQRHLDEIQFDPEADRIFSVGDLVDRGPDCQSNLNAALLSRKPWFHAVMGNHEDMFVQYIKAELEMSPHAPRITSWYTSNGGAWAMHLFHGLNGELVHRELLAELAGEFSRMPRAMEIETDDGLVGVIHAEIPFMSMQEGTMRWEDFRIAVADDNLPNNMKEEVIWGRQLTNYILQGRNPDAIKMEVDGLHRLYSGHTIVNSPMEVSNRVWIDTGAFHTGNLTMVQIQ